MVIAEACSNTQRAIGKAGRGSVDFNRRSHQTWVEKHVIRFEESARQLNSEREFDGHIEGASSRGQARRAEVMNETQYNG